MEDYRRQLEEETAQRAALGDLADTGEARNEEDQTSFERFMWEISGQEDLARRTLARRTLDYSLNLLAQRLPTY